VKILSGVLFCLVFSLSFAELGNYEAVVEIDAEEVESFLSNVEMELDININSSEISAQAVSVKDGFVIQRSFDITYNGITFEALCQVAGLGTGRVSISISAPQRHAMEAICLSFLNAGAKVAESPDPTSCDFEEPEVFTT
jgi:hypothetical protein